jgi:hypothetical protein
VRSVVEVATEAASVVKVVAAEEVTAVDEGGGRGGAPIATPNTHCGVLGGGGVWPHNATSTQSAVLKNTGASPEGIIGTRCNCPPPDPVWSPARTRGLSEERRDCARILRGTCVQQWWAVAGGRRMLAWKVNQEVLGGRNLHRIWTIIASACQTVCRK